jgi:hypothetical protein
VLVSKIHGSALSVPSWPRRSSEEGEGGHARVRLRQGRLPRRGGFDPVYKGFIGDGFKKGLKPQAIAVFLHGHVFLLAASPSPLPLCPHQLIDSEQVCNNDVGLLPVVSLDTCAAISRKFVQF